MYSRAITTCPPCFKIVLFLFKMNRRQMLIYFTYIKHSSYDIYFFLMISSILLKFIRKGFKSLLYFRPLKFGRFSTSHLNFPITETQVTDYKRFKCFGFGGRVYQIALFRLPPIV